MPNPKEGSRIGNKDVGEMLRQIKSILGDEEFNKMDFAAGGMGEYGPVKYNSVIIRGGREEKINPSGAGQDMQPLRRGDIFLKQVSKIKSFFRRGK